MWCGVCDRALRCDDWQLLGAVEGGCKLQSSFERTCASAHVYKDALSIYVFIVAFPTFKFSPLPHMSSSQHRNKDPLLFVSGHRSFPARPIFSTDEHGADKHKMERYLQHGRPAVATVYAPICYPPVPLLVFE